MRLPIESANGRSYDCKSMNHELFAARGLSLDRLRAFSDVAAAGGIAKAAKGDPIRQSQLSRQIRELENFFEVSLTAKKGRTIVLTPAGETLAVIIRHIFTHLTDFKRAQHNQSLELSLGAGESILQWLVLPKIVEMRNRLPAVVFSFRNFRTEKIVHAVQDGSLDLGVLRTDAVPKELRSSSLGTLRYKIFVPARLAEGRTTLTWMEALKLPFVGLEGEGQLMSKLRQTAEAKSITLRTEFFCASLPAIAEALTRVDASAVLPTIVANAGAPDNLVAVEAPFLHRFDRPLSLVWNPRQANVRPAADSARVELTKLLRIAPQK